RREQVNQYAPHNNLTRNTEGALSQPRPTIVPNRCWLTQLEETAQLRQKLATELEPQPNHDDWCKDCDGDTDPRKQLIQRICDGISQGRGINRDQGNHHQVSKCEHLIHLLSA